MRTNAFSKKCFFNALLDLYKEKPYSEIQISEICRKAGYNRSTFYRIYSTKEELLLDGFREEYSTEYYHSIPPLRTGSREAYLQNVEQLFAFLRKKHDFLLLMREARMLEEMYNIFRDVFPLSLGDDQNGSLQYERSFLSAGYLAVLYRWLDGGMQQSDAAMAQMLAGMMDSLPQNSFC